ncbi:18800_t:CDS:2, partial [Racocetra persica]
STRLKRQKTTEDLSQEIYSDLQEAPKALATGKLEDWWDVNGEGSESSDVCLEDRINEIYNLYFDNVEEVVPEIDIGKLEEKDRDQFETTPSPNRSVWPSSVLVKPQAPLGSTCVLDLSLTRWGLLDEEDRGIAVAR